MKQETARLRRIACHELILPNGQRLTHYVVEILNGYMVNHYPLLQEIPNTEWLIGQVVLKEGDEGRIQAFYNKKPII